MTQEAPFPHALADLVAHLRYKTWRFELAHEDRGQGSMGLTLIAHVTGPDTYNPATVRSVSHLFIVPAASYNLESWQRWVFDRCLDVELHEAMEHFIVDGIRPYAPNHGPGQDPYIVRELTTDEARRTSFRGIVKPIHSDDLHGLPASTPMRPDPVIPEKQGTPSPAEGRRPWRDQPQA